MSRFPNNLEKTYINQLPTAPKNNPKSSGNGLTSELDNIIPPEIKSDEFYYKIEQIAQEANVKTVLEIGSSAGAGSTEAFVNGLSKNPYNPVLFCMEISRPRFAELQKRYGKHSFVKCYNVSSVSLKEFSSKKEVVHFYNTTTSALNEYPLDRVLGWLHQDIDYVKESGFHDCGIQRIKKENKIDNFDMVLIDGSEFTGKSELNLVYGAKIIMLDDINGYKNYHNFLRLSNDPDYLLVTENKNLRNGYAIFKRNSEILPIHFFTIVLNGEPYIRYHVDVLKKLPFNWHWHIVEGVADLKHDTSWSLQYGGRITDEIHRNGQSNDGTTDYLNDMIEQYPNNITVYRKSTGMFWDGKLEMVNAPLANITESCLLWQIDADELWTLEQICAVRQMFLNQPSKTAAYYFCNYFVGENLVTTTRNTYGNNTSYEWLRTWRFEPGAYWKAHEPPILCKKKKNGTWVDIAKINPFLHSETEAQSLIFQHFAYATEQQVKFKELYFGYKGAVEKWRLLQQTLEFPVYLRDYFSWVKDETQVDLVVSLNSKLHRSLSNQKAQKVKSNIKTVNNSKNTRTNEGDQAIGNVLDASMITFGKDRSHQKKNNRKKILVVSHERSGTHFLINAIALNFPYYSNNELSVIGDPHELKSIFEAYYSIEEKRIFKSHHQFYFYSHFIEELVQNFHVFYVIRDGRDVLNSCFHYFNKHPDVFPASKDVEEFLKSVTYKEYSQRYAKNMTERWLFHVQSWLSVKDKIFIVRYEDLKFKFKDTIADIANLLKFEAPEPICEPTLKDRSIDPRKGIVGDWSDQFTANDLVSFNNSASKCMNELGYYQNSNSVSLNPKKIIWVRTDSIGDNVLAASALPAIRGEHLNAQLAVVCQDSISPLYKRCPFVDDIISFNKSRALKDEQYRNEIIQSLREFNADIALNSVYSREILTDIFSLESGAKTTVAFNGNLCNISAEIRDKNNQFYTQLLPGGEKQKTELRRHTDFLKSIGINISSLQPTIWSSREDEDFADEFFEKNNLNPDKTIVLYAGAQYTVRHYNHYGIALSQAIKGRGFTVIALGSYNEYSINQENIDSIGIPAINLAGKTTILQAAALLKRCRLSVGAETGLAHISCAVGTPNVVLLGGGHFGRFMPYSPLTSIVCLPLDCYGCNWQCRFSHPRCVQDVMPRVISEAVCQALNKRSDKMRIYLETNSSGPPKKNYPELMQLFKPLDIDVVDFIPVGRVQPKAKGEVLNQLGESLFAKGDLKGSVEAFKKALDIDISNAESHNNLGVVYYNQGDKEKAFDHYKMAAELQPENITFQKNLADFYCVEQGRVEEAMQIYVKVLNADPKDIETLLVLAHICIVLKKVDDARYFSSRILEIEPGNKDARIFFEKLREYQLGGADRQSLTGKNKINETFGLKKNILTPHARDFTVNSDSKCATGGLPFKVKNPVNAPSAREITIADANSEQPIISIITPSFNQGQYIEQTIQMVQKQNYSNFEHIIIDGGSTDETIEILKRYPHLKWLSEKDSGQSEALNKGLRIAKGEIVGWINSDDWYEPGTFEAITSFFKANPTKNVVMGNCNLVDENRIIFDKVINEERGFEELKKYWIGRSIPTQPAVFFRRKLLDEHGYIDENLHYAMDYDLWMRFAQKNYFHHLDVTVANYRFHQAAKGGDQDWSKFVPECKIVFERYTRQPGSSPLISVIIPSFNYGKYLCEAVESVINQTFHNFEIIIINDGSTDNTKEVAESLIAKHPNYSIRLINQENSGQPAISRNRGIQEANGEYILCLDADDMLLPTMLEKCLNTLNQDESIAIAYTDRQDFDGADQIVQARDYDFSQLKYANHISYCALFRKVVWEKIGGYRTNIKVCEDWDFWVAAGAKGFFGRRIPEPLFMYRRHHTGLNQEILKNYNKKFAEIIFNNQEVYTVDDLNHANKLLGQNSEIAPDACSPVSVIVPTFNRPEMLKEALKSILNQTYQNFEIVVVNDCGEGVSDLIDKFQDKRIKYFRHAQNKGLAAARNTGIKNASGQFIALLDDDDAFLPEHLQIALKNLSEKYPVIYTDAIRASYERRGTTYKLLKKSVPYSIDFDRNKLLIGNISPVNCFVFNKNLAVKAGLFDETLSTLEDWEFWIRISALTPFKHVAQPTVQVNWRTDGTTMTSSRASEFKKNREKIYDRYQSEINRVPNLQAILEEFQQIWANDWQDQAQLTSIIILTCNQLAFTKKCIDSIYKHTSEPFEFIVVDNGSTDGTIPYLEALSKKRGNKVPIKIIKNRKNLGFAAGNNQGIAASVGDYILLMNNDIVVTPGWLDRLIRCAEQDPAMGIVGPLSNYVSGPQLVKDVSYDTQTLTGLNEFAKRFAAANSGRKQRLIRVVGFCMLVKRAVIEKIGGMDSAYGLGNFEDDDFSLRAALAGFESWMVQDCFVHHFGSRTFIGEQIDYRESLQKNWEIFKQKWKLPAELSYDSGYSLSLLGVTSFDPSDHYIPYQKAVQVEPANPTFQKNLCKVTYLNRQGEDLIEKGDLEGTLDAFKKALEKDPSNATTHNDLGVLYYNQGDKEKALKYYLKAAKLDPENITFQKNIADFYYVEMGRVEDALRIYVKILESNPEDIETLLITGHICIALEKFQDAEVFYNRVLEIEPGHQDARQFLEKLTSIKPDDSGAKTPEERYDEVKLLLDNGDPHRAIDALERLLENFPDFALAHSDLGVLHSNCGNKEQALHHYEKALQIQPENITVKKNLADYYLVELDRKEEALKIYLSLLNDHPNDLEVNLTAAHICVAMHKINKAKVLYKQVLIIDPENEDARNNLRILGKIKGDLRVDQQPETESLQKNTSEKYSPAKETIGVMEAPKKDIPQFSIIIPTSAPLKQIRRCVESLKNHTSESHEILFVNNGATKGVLKWVRRCIDHNHNRRLVKCGKGANTAVCHNTGIKAAWGEYIVLLSNDVVVTEGWLSSMLQCFSSIPNTGMVGTMANRAKSRQKITAAVNLSLNEINAFAESYRAANRYRRIECDILDGFCLIFRRDLTEKIGLFDEQTSVLGFEDEDYCIRAALEGYVNQIAGDVYLHRFEHKEPVRSKKNFYLKWSGTDFQSATGKKHLALRAVEKANRAGEEGKIDLAVELFLQAIGLLPEHKESYYKLAEMLVNTKRFKDALDVLNELPEGDPDARQLELAACCKEGLELLEEAQGYADQVLEIGRCATSALNTKGMIAFRRHDKNAAESYFARAMETDPGFGEAYTNLGGLKWAAGFKDEALDLYERGFILSPTVPDIALNYHCALADLVEYQRAESVVRDAAAVHPHNKKIRYMLIDLLIHQRKDGMAMQEIQRAIADFGLDDGILPSALKIREKIGPLTLDKITAFDSSVSLCMIVKDEEDHLARCLQSVGPVVDEIIIVDTGSKDRSRDIARVFGAKVFDFKWAEDFAEARNYSLSKATGKMIFIMDADEVLSPLDYELFRRTARQSSRQRSAFIINTRNYTMDNNLVEWVANEGHYAIEEAGSGWTPSAKIRLFPNDPHIRFDFPVHEMVEPSLQKLGIAMRTCKFQVHHYGKLNRDKSERKGEAYYEIGCKKLEEMGDSPVALKELAIQAEGLKKHQEAVELWQRFIAIVPNDPKAFINMGISYCNLGQFDKVLVTAEEALKHAPDSKEGHYNCALAKLHLGHPDQAIEILEKLCKEMPEYLPARFILAAACCCREDKKRGMALLKELSATAIGPGLAIRCHELARRFVSLQRSAYALALLDAAIDSQNANKDVLDLYTDCLKRTDFYKKTGTYE